MSETPPPYEDALIGTVVVIHESPEKNRNIGGTFVNVPYIINRPTTAAIITITVNSVWAWRFVANNNVLFK